MPDHEPADISFEGLMNALGADAKALDVSCARLVQQVKAFEGAKDGQLGVKLAWEAAVDQCMLAVEREMLTDAGDPANKLPASLKARSSKMMEAEARIRAKREHPDLWVEYAEMEAEIRALEKWIRAKERSSLRQSILSAQKRSNEIE